MATEYNFPTISRGDVCEGLDITLNWAANGTPVDLTDASIRSQFRAGNSKGQVGYEASVGAGIAILNATLGRFELQAFRTAFATSCDYVYDIEVTLADGFIVTPIYGTQPLRADVTR